MRRNKAVKAVRTEIRRPSWEEFWFLLALMYSTRGTCDRLRTACLIVKNNQLKGAGYNGSPPGTAHCDDVGHLIIDGHCERTIHGEGNAILHTSREDLVGATAYVISTPCYRCAKALVTAGVKRVNYMEEYSNSRGREQIKQLAKDTGVKFTHCDIEPAALIARALVILKGPGGALQK